jgi:hypothetical protein
MSRHPSLDEFLRADTHTTWTREHRGVKHQAAFWGYGAKSDLFDAASGPRGTWNFYLILPERQWRPKDWARFLAPRKDFGITPGRTHKGWDYHESGLAGLDWHGDMTFYEHDDSHPMGGSIKAGCDYEHLFDAEMGYPYSLTRVEIDARACVDSLLERFTPLVKCRYTGEYGEPGEMVPTKWAGEFVLARVKGQVWPQWFVMGDEE